MTIDLNTIPPPPPPLDEEVSRASFSPVKRVWDTVAVYGPETQDALRQHIGPSNGDYREYLRFHPEVKGNASDTIMIKAERFVFDRAVEQGVRRGWLLRDADGVLSVGPTPPPGHRPLSTIGGKAGVERSLAHLDSKEALRILTVKTQHPARWKQDKELKASVAHSIKEIGQRYPILMWKPHPMLSTDDIVVDGRARIEALTKLGVPESDWKVEYLSPDLPASEVLWWRINLETGGFSKDTSPKSRNDFIVQLAQAGISPKEIGERVNRTRRRVQQILSQVEGDFHLRQESPTAAEVDEFAALRDAGWTLRQIEDETQWSKDTIQRHLAKQEAGSPEKNPEPRDEVELPAKMLPGTGPKSMKFLVTLVERGSGTVKDICETAGLDPSTIKGGTRAALLSRGYIQDTGERHGRGVVYEPTPLLRSQLSELSEVTPPESKPKLMAVLTLPPPDLNEALLNEGFTQLQVNVILDVLAHQGIDVPLRSRRGTATGTDRRLVP